MFYLLALAGSEPCATLCACVSGNAGSAAKEVAGAAISNPLAAKWREISKKNWTGKSAPNWEVGELRWEYQKDCIFTYKKFQSSVLESS